MTTVIAARMPAQVPFHATLGLQVQQADPGHGVVLLPNAPGLVNHVGTAHAGALFTLADAAAGAVVLPLLLDRIDRVDFTVRAAEVRYLTPARGAITATARFGSDASPEQLLAELAAAGRLELDVVVDLHDRQETPVATVLLHWHLRQRRPG